MAKLFKPPPTPPDPERFLDNLMRWKLGLHGKPLNPEAMLLGYDPSRNQGQFHAKLYDAQTHWGASQVSKRWRLIWPKDSKGRELLDQRPRKEYGFWNDIIDGVDLTAAGTRFDCKAISPGDQTYRDLNVQFYQMAGREQKDKLPLPSSLITDATNPLGPIYYSIMNSTVELGGSRGFYRIPPQSHYMERDVKSSLFGKWIEPDLQSIIDYNPGNYTYWDNAVAMRAFLKPGVTYMKMWCPSGEYREFDTSDTEHYKVTGLLDAQAPSVSLPIKCGYEVGSQWEMYLVPQTIQMLSEWWDYYMVVTFFTLFIWGFHTIENHIGRFPQFPVPYGSVLGELGILGGEDLLFISDWIYYVAQWHGAFAPPLTSAHPLPTGDGIWEGPPVHTSDYAVEYAIKHNSLVKHNPHDLEGGNAFFNIMYIGSSPVSYFTRLAFQPTGALCAIIKPRGSGWMPLKDTYYVWQIKRPAELVRRTMNWGTMFYDWDSFEGDIWTLPWAMYFGGWADAPFL